MKTRDGHGARLLWHIITFFLGAREAIGDRSSACLEHGTGAQPCHFPKLSHVRTQRTTRCSHEWVKSSRSSLSVREKRATRKSGNSSRRKSCCAAVWGAVLRLCVHTRVRRQSPIASSRQHPKVCCACRDTRISTIFQ